MSSDPVPDWVRPVAGFTAGDLDLLPGLPPHTELIDGGLVFVSPQRKFHMNVVSLIESALRGCAPADWRVQREMSVVLDDQQRPEPDVSVIQAAALGDGTETWYPASAVLLAIEVVSPDSQVRDRDRKPQLYARAGIQHFWRVEEAEGKAVVYVFELDPATATYALAGIHHEKLSLTVPFGIEIDLSTVHSL
jgi:Uma2 family endonuclease